MSSVLLIFHVLTIAVSAKSFPLKVLDNRWAVIGGSSLGLLLVLAFPLLRKPSYEIFIRTHQALAALSVYAIWRHLVSKPLSTRLYVYIFSLMFLLMSLLQCGFTIYQNKAIGRGYSRASITYINDIIKIRLHLSRPIRVRAGQYIGLWIPTVSFWSFTQSHPFVVTSWSEGKQSSLDLFIEPQRGLTQEILRHSKISPDGLSSYLALFTGPHGISAPVGEYETVLMVASGFGIAAQLPYLKKLIYGYNACKTHTRRIHLVWQLENINIGLAAESLLNDALIDDTLDEGYILSISIFIKSEILDKVYFGRRAVLHNGTVDLRTTLQDEVAGKYIKRVQAEFKKNADILVIVSATDHIRDELRDLVRDYLDKKVKLLELEYQPAA